MSQFEYLLPELNNEMQVPDYFNLCPKSCESAKQNRLTSDQLMDFESHLNLSSGIFLENFKSQQSLAVYKQSESIIRTKKIIEVSERTRKMYIKSKKGKSRDTNDLSLHAFSLIKSSFQQFQTFISPNDKKLQILQGFKNVKGSIKILQQFFIAMNENESKEHNQMGVEDQQNSSSFVAEKNEKFTKFLSDHLQSSNIIKKILANKKMVFSNKQMLIRFLPTIRKSLMYPRNLKRWKSFSSSSPSSNLKLNIENIN